MALIRQVQSIETASVLLCISNEHSQSNIIMYNILFVYTLLTAHLHQIGVWDAAWERNRCGILVIPS